MIKNVAYSFVIVLLLWACNESHIEPSPVVYNSAYFPLDSSAWRTYQATYIVIDKASEVYDTVNYFVKEVCAGWTLDATHDSMMRLERYVKSEIDQPWDINQVWQAGIVNHEAIQVEENIRYIKLKFPAELGKTWNGNAYNRLDTLEQYSFIVSDLDEPYLLNDLSFDSVLTVTQKDKESLIDKVLFTEKYAKGIGLIEKIQIDIRGDEDIDPLVNVEDRITKGTIYRQTLIDYGKE
jgi:hypothetical protein